MADFFVARSEFAAQLSSVDGVRGFEWRPSAPKPGDCWPKRGRSEHPGAGVLQTNWTLVLVLPADEQKSEQWINDRLEALFDAISPIAYITGFETGTATDRPALLIDCIESGE